MSKILTILLFVSLLLNIKQCEDISYQSDDIQIIDYEVIELETELNKSKKEIQKIKKDQQQNNPTKVSLKKPIEKPRHIEIKIDIDSTNTNIITDTLNTQ